VTQVVVVPPGDEVQVHWQQSGYRPTITETLTRPTTETLARLVLSLSQWMQHTPNCGRIVNGSGDCTCGLMDALQRYA
jgi:hypothetical protein